MNPDRREKLSEYFAARYGDRSAEHASASALIRGGLFRRWAGSGKRILDVGCGSGTILRFLTEGNRVTGIDVDRQALETCGERYGIETVWADFSTELPFDGGAFDLVVAGETIEHLPYPMIFLQEVRRVLIPDGLFLGSVPNAYRLQNRLHVLEGKPLDRDRPTSTTSPWHRLERSSRGSSRWRRLCRSGESGPVSLPPSSLTTSPGAVADLHPESGGAPSSGFVAGSNGIDAFLLVRPAAAALLRGVYGHQR